MTDADPRAVFQLVRGNELLPLDDFIALDRRDSLFGYAAAKSLTSHREAAMNPALIAELSARIISTPNRNGAGNASQRLGGLTR